MIADQKAELEEGVTEEMCKLMENRKIGPILDYVLDHEVAKKKLSILVNDYRGEVDVNDVVDKLTEQNITTVVTGHIPFMDSPFVLKLENGDKKVKIISNDTSQSKPKSKSDWGVNNRGDDTMSEVRVFEDGTAEIQGVTNEKINQNFNVDEEDMVGRLVEKEVKDKGNHKWYVKAVTEDGKYKLDYSEGRATGTVSITKEELEELLK